MVNHKPQPAKKNQIKTNESDYEKIEDSFVTITPLKADLTDFKALQKLKKQI